MLSTLMDPPEHVWTDLKVAQYAKTGIDQITSLTS